MKVCVYDVFVYQGERAMGLSRVLGACAIDCGCAHFRVTRALGACGIDCLGPTLRLGGKGGEHGGNDDEGKGEALLSFPPEGVQG